MPGHRTLLPDTMHISEVLPVLLLHHRSRQVRILLIIIVPKKLQRHFHQKPSPPHPSAIIATAKARARLTVQKLQIDRSRTRRIQQALDWKPHRLVRRDAQRVILLHKRQLNAIVSLLRGKWQPSQIRIGLKSLQSLSSASPGFGVIGTLQPLTLWQATC
jgi:hypothetical protein